MLSVRPWRLDLILQFLGIVLFGYSTGSLVIAWLISEHAPLALNKEYVLLIGGPLSFQGLALVLVPRLLREHDMNLESAFGITLRRLASGVLIGVAAGVAALPVIFLVGQLSQTFLEARDIGFKLQVPVELLRNDPSMTPRILVFLAAVVLAPAAEEILFRGLLYPSVKQLGFPRLALWGTSILFGLIHFNLMAALPLAVFALILTLLYEATDNLLCPITAHTFFNFVNFVFLVRSSDAPV